MTHQRIALVLGATGGIGGEVARRLQASGWAVRAMHRNAAKAASNRNAVMGVSWVEGDAMRPADVEKAARGTSLIVHAVNPPGYRNWGELVLPMLESTISAAHSSGARILLPGNVYNYGPDAFPSITEASPQNPRTRKGAVRVEMERRLRSAADKGVRTLIVRAGDFFGPRARNNWFAQGLVKPGRPVSFVSYPGKRNVGHQWAYLPDVAETMVQLLQREDALETFSTFHMEGHWDPDGTEMIAAIRRVVGTPDLKVRAFPWWLVIVAAPVVPLFRELREMRYLWQTPVRMGNARLLSVLGAEPHTPLEQAVRATLSDLGCLNNRDTVSGGPERVAT
jgi:nucleoside-diphosphate-sugar epimerase